MFDDSLAQSVIELADREGISIRKVCRIKGINYDFLMRYLSSRRDIFPPMRDRTMAKYASVLELAGGRDISLKEACRRLGIKPGSFFAYIKRHRDRFPKSLTQSGAEARKKKILEKYKAVYDLAIGEHIPFAEACRRLGVSENSFERFRARHREVFPRRPDKIQQEKGPRLERYKNVIALARREGITRRRACQRLGVSYSAFTTMVCRFPDVLTPARKENEK